MTFPGFSSAALQFLRGLGRNNRRPWFQRRKHIYEQELKLPLIELVTAINAELGEFAPEYVTAPQKSIFRIYRDTRFNPDKRPYKTHVAAVFPKQRIAKHSGACFYFHFS